jgi:S-adenosylmethionine uptake transporter
VLVILSGQAEAKLGHEAFLGTLAILASAMLYAYNIILMRQQAQVADPFEIAFFMSLIMTSCFALAAPFLAVLPAPQFLPGLVGAAILAFLSLILLSWAYARAEAQHLAPVEYTSFIWAAILGLLVFGESVQPLTLLGAAMIVVACLIASRGHESPVAEAAL